MRPSRRAVLISAGVCAVLVAGFCLWWASASIRPPTAPPPVDPWDGGVGAAEGRAVFASCASCHLADASGRPDGSIPRLGGQRAPILEGKLRRLAAGEVVLPAMSAFACALQPDEIGVVSLWLAALPDPSIAAVPAGPGASLYAGLCRGCHGPRAEGNDALGAPRLCGQHAPYLVRRMEESAANARGDGDPAMAAIVSAVGAPDRQAVADWLAAGVCSPEGAP